MIILLTGIIFVLGILPGIGPQNLNILSHGIRQNYHYVVGTTCVIADGVLIILGGVGLKLSNSQTIILVINIVGIIFIGFYILLKAKDLFNVHDKYNISSQIYTLKTSITRALVLTWLNPLVFIDTVVIIGGASSHYIGKDWFCFMLGAILGDIIWIYGLVFVSSKLSYKLNHPTVWFILDILTILIMTFILYQTIILVLR
ncbi:MAG: LysE family transporter [Burkholderiales bacterium]|nr:LysE family transporter [Burkholderiales bacterium]